IKSSDPALKLWVGELMYDTFFLGFNQRPEVETLSYEPILNIFANKSVRQAFSYAFNHSAYIQQVQDGLGEQLLGPVPEGIAAAADFPFYEFNLTAAAEKWNEAMSTGWLETVLDNCSFELHLAYPTGATYAEAAFIILKDGIIEMLTNSSYGAIQPSQPLTINIYALEYGYYQERYVDKGLSVYYFYSHSNYPDPNDSITRIVRSSSSPASRIDLSISDGWNATDLDASISIAAQETYPSDRYDLYQSIQDEISNHSAYLWVSQLPNVHIQKKDMYGYTFIPNRGVYFYHLWKIIRPTITPIMDFELELGTSGSTIDWTVSAESPSNYSIYRNYTKIDSGNWTGTMIQHTIGPLDVGLYNFTLIIWDENSLTATNTVFVTVVDTTGPSATATHVPIQPSNLDEVDVTAFVEDLSTIVNVTLSYSTDLGATWTSIEMTQTGTSTWNAIIPQQSSGSNVAYKIYSQDEYNNQGISSTYLYAVIEATTSPTNTITETTWSSTPTTPTTTGPSGFGDSSILILTLGGTIIVLVFIVFVFVRKTRS
ncbi:MAG: ABC transporter substrate-binding protein, partial [Candidatus Thorarchaeota archaeon]